MGIAGNVVTILDGFKEIDGADLRKLGASSQNQQGIIALAGGGQSALAPTLSYGYNDIITVASGSDSLTAPFAIAGNEFKVRNKAASNDATIYGSLLVNPITGLVDAFETTTGTPVLGSTGVTATHANKVIYECFTNGIWTKTL